MQQQSFKKVQPLLGRVLVQKLVPPKKTGSGILLPDAKNQTNIGRIISIGSGKVLENGTISKINLQEGQYVLYQTMEELKFLRLMKWMTYYYTMQRIYLQL